MKAVQIPKWLASSTHELLARSPRITRWYLTALGSLLRPLPECKVKRQIFNSVFFVEWPEYDLPARQITLGTRTHIVIHPHFHAIDFEALVSRHPLYEKEVFAFLESRLADYDTVLEIGANVGLFSLFFAKTFEQMGKKNGQVFAFEPSREAYRRLLQNLKLNSIKNIQVFNCAVGDQTVFADFFEPKGHLTNGSLLPEFAGHFSASLLVSRTLVLHADLLESLLPHGKRALVKIDTEGSECRVLIGLKDVIMKKKPDILLEVLSIYQDNLNKLEFLKRAGYQFFNITDRGPIQYEQFTTSDFRDWLLVPSEAAVSPPKPTRQDESR